MKKPEILNYKNVTETQSEQVLLEKWRQWTCAKQGCHKPSVCKKYSIFEYSMKYKSACLAQRQATNETAKGTQKLSMHLWKGPPT